METEVDIYAKSAALKFIGENTRVRCEFLADVECSYYAPEIVYLFQNISHIIFQVFVGVVSAYLFHQLYQKRNAKKSQEKLEEKIRKVLEKHKNDIDSSIKELEEYIDSFAK